MEYRELRELVHIRHELRRFATQTNGAPDRNTDRAEMSALLRKMTALASKDPETQASVNPEVERWRVRLGLDKT